MCRRALQSDSIAYVEYADCVPDKSGHTQIAGISSRATVPVEKYGLPPNAGGSVAERSACWTQTLKGPGSNRSRDAVE